MSSNTHSRMAFCIEILQRMASSRSTLIGMIIIAFWLIVMLISIFWTPYSTDGMDLLQRLQPPSFEHPCGTDKFGRDLLSRIMAGSQQVISIALVASILAIVSGTIVGLVSGYLGKIVDELLMRFMDILMSFPSLLLAILVIGMLGPGSLNTILVIAIVFCPRVARVCRSAVIEVVTKEFVEAARTRRASLPHMLFIEILPNILGTIGVEFTVRFAYSIFLGASLGFLGLGVQPPTPDWGLLINEGREFMMTNPYLVIFPSLAIASLVIAVNLISDAAQQLAQGDI